MAQFADLFAIVTGAGGGIGRAITRALLNDGATVWAAGRTESTLAETVLGFGSRGRAYPTDLSEDSDVDLIASDAEREFGGLDILVHCAGTIDHGAIADSTPQMLDLQFRSNVRLPYVVTHRLLPLLRKRAGQIVFVNSSIVSGPPRPNMSQFAASQHAVRAFAETLRLEVNPDGIRVLCVYPGRTATSRQAGLYEQEGKTYEADLLLQPEDIATMIVAALALPPTAEVTDIGIRPMLKSY